jgi:RimJ/RimL family protein N-acetyltransferase
MKFERIVLTGLRAQLEPLSPEHADALFVCGMDPRIWQYIPDRIATLEDMNEWVLAALAEEATGKSLPFAVRDMETDRVVGSTRLLDYDSRNQNVEIGYTWYSPDVWRTRINTECKYLLLTHCFETLGMIRVQLKTDARNVRSQQAIVRIGGVREGALRHHRIMPDGYLRDSVYFSILQEEWTDVKLRLERFLGPNP